MRFWNPRRAAAYKIVDDALDFYGPTRLKLVAQHLNSIGSSIASTEESGAQVASQDEQTYVLFTKLRRLNESSKPMFESVIAELKRYSDNTLVPSGEEKKK